MEMKKKVMKHMRAHELCFEVRTVNNTINVSILAYLTSF